MSENEGTKHGAFIFDQDGRLVSAGYNGYVAGVDAPAEVRMDKARRFKWQAHAERNALSFTDNNFRLRGATLYVTGRPCIECGMYAMTMGIKRIVYGSVESTCASDEVDLSDLLFVAREKRVEIVSYSGLSFALDAVFETEVGQRKVSVAEGSST